ncbi:MAG: AAA family ATPase [candidate division Zixibacteria bacterium]|nr:AAA family ATPase [candidate division Zixibacteria bacterium]
MNAAPLQVPRIVITGAPASGKTEFLQRLKGEPVLETFLFFDEVARRLLEENPGYRKDWGGFHREIYRRQVRQERRAGERPFITDRGTADAFAFHPETMTVMGTTIKEEYRRYSAVVQLGSSAALGERYYRMDAIRNESIEDVLAIEKAITGIWRGHPGYRFIETRPDTDRKYRHLLSVVNGMVALWRQRPSS